MASAQEERLEWFKGKTVANGRLASKQPIAIKPMNCQ